MNYAHYDFRARGGNLIEVSLDSQANVMLMSDLEYQRYRRGQQARGQGGWAQRSPIRLEVPRDGHWHVVIDLGGRRGTVNHAARLVTAA